MSTAFRDLLPISVIAAKTATAAGADTKLQLTGTLLILTGDDGNAADNVMVQFNDRDAAFTWDPIKTAYYISAGQTVVFAGDLACFDIYLRSTANVPNLAYSAFQEQ